MIVISETLRKEINDLAYRLGTSIPGTIDLVLWSLPILEELTIRIIELEEKIKKLEGKDNA